MQKIIEKVKKKLEEVMKHKNIAVIYHYDLDGCVSAAILWRLFKKRGINAEFFPATRGYDDITLGKIKTRDFDKIVFVDYFLREKYANELKDYNVSVIDHHQHENYLDIFNYITTADYGNDVAISYTLSKTAEVFGIKNLGWLAFIGAYWDKVLEKTEFYKEGIYKERINELLPFNLVASLTQTRGSEKVFEILKISSSLEDALERIKELEDYRKASEIFREERAKINSTRKQYPNLKLEIFFVKTKFRHMRIHVDYITFTEEGTFVFVLDEKIRYKFSFRTSLDINLLDIVRNLSKEIPYFGGGGHIKACGGLLEDSDFDDFLKKFIEEYKKHISQH